MIKVVIFPGYGDSCFPDHIMNKVTKHTFPRSRTGEIVEYLEGLPIATGDIQKLYKSVKEGETLRLSEDVFVFGEKPYPITCRIVTVDNERPWTISNYDGAEDIDYINPQIIDEEMNYWEL